MILCDRWDYFEQTRASGSRLHRYPRDSEGFTEHLNITPKMTKSLFLENIAL